jgi:hypothetical protein
MAFWLGPALAQEGRNKLGDQPNPNQKGTIFVRGTPWPNPNNFNELCTVSAAIIDGTINDTLPVRRSVSSDPRSLETDVIVNVNKVFKGDQTLQKIMIAEGGGTNGELHVVDPTNPQMLPGERYFLFLLREQRTTLPLTPGIPRYAVVAGSLGKVVVDGVATAVVTPKPSPFQQQLVGIPTEAFALRIAACVTQ